MIFRLCEYLPGLNKYLLKYQVVAFEIGRYGYLWECHLLYQAQLACIYLKSS